MARISLGSQFVPGGAAIGCLIRAVSQRHRGAPGVDREDCADVILHRRRQFLPMRAAVGGAQDRSRAADNPANLLGRRGAAEQVSPYTAELQGPRFSSVGGKFDVTGLPDLPRDKPAGGGDGDCADAVGEAHFRFLAELGHAPNLLLLSDTTGRPGWFGRGLRLPGGNCWHGARHRATCRRWRGCGLLTRSGRGRIASAVNRFIFRHDFGCVGLGCLNSLRQLGAGLQGLFGRRRRFTIQGVVGHLRGIISDPGFFPSV